MVSLGKYFINLEINGKSYDYDFCSRLLLTEFLQIFIQFHVLLMKFFQ